MKQILREPDGRFVITCKHCNCMFTYNYVDIVDEDPLLYSNNTEIWSYVTCPYCHTKLSHLQATPYEEDHNDKVSIMKL